MQDGTAYAFTMQLHHISEAPLTTLRRRHARNHPITYNGLISGDVDVYMEVWVDNLPTYQDDLKAGKFKELGINFDDNKQGLYVPEYVIEGSERGIEPMAPDLKLWKISKVQPCF